MIWELLFWKPAEKISLKEIEDSLREIKKQRKEQTQELVEIKKLLKTELYFLMKAKENLDKIISDGIRVKK